MFTMYCFIILHSYRSAFPTFKIKYEPISDFLLKLLSNVMDAKVAILYNFFVFCLNNEFTRDNGENQYTKLYVVNSISFSSD